MASIWETVHICKKKNHFAKCYNNKKVNYVKKYRNNSKSDENGRIFENEALFIGATSNEDFTPFDNETMTTMNRQQI